MPAIIASLSWGLALMYSLERAAALAAERSPTCLRSRLFNTFIAITRQWCAGGIYKSFVNSLHLDDTPFAACGADIYRPVATKMQRFINKCVFTTSKE